MQASTAREDEGPSRTECNGEHINDLERPRVRSVLVVGLVVMVVMVVVVVVVVVVTTGNWVAWLGGPRVTE